MTIRQRVSRLLVLPIVSSFFGCATVFRGTTQVIHVDSKPPGATASVSGQSTTTPGTLRLKRKLKSLEIRFAKPGFREKSVTLQRRMSGGVWFNLLAMPVGGVGGAVLAPSTHSTFGSGLSVSNEATGSVVGAVVLPLALIGTDVITGAAYRLEPESVLVTLEPENTLSDKQ
jgi:hypothetical protein